MTGVGNIWRAVLLALSFCMVASATESIIRIHVGRAGLFSAAGHEHWVSAPIERGSLDDSDPSAHVAFIVQARKLMVVPDKISAPKSRLKCNGPWRKRCSKVISIPRSAFAQGRWRRPRPTRAAFGRYSAIAPTFRR